MSRRAEDEFAAMAHALDPAERAQVAAFLRKAAGLRLALARTAAERVAAVDDWLNAHGLPPAREEPPVPTGSHRGTVTLPAATPLPPIALEQVLRERRSHYHYSARPLPLTGLADLLHHALRVHPGSKHGAGTALPLSPAPSAGGHNPVGVHLAARDVDGLHPGVYTYDRDAHTLTVTWTGDPSPSLAAVYGQPEFAARVPVTVLLTAAVREPVARYGPRHYRTLHVDTGIAAQNLYLVATALGLRGCAVAGYRDGAAHRMLGCTDREITTLLFPLGAPPP